MASRQPRTCEWPTFEEALRTFVLAEAGTQGSSHISPMHWHVACRLVVEGGFDPDFITPRPPFVVRRKGRRAILSFDEAAAGSGEATVLGGLKTKDIDVVVAIPGIGPCLAVSMKGSLNAFRNLTNRLEEAIGDCANIHMGYPALVYGFLILIRANREGLVPPVLAGRLAGDENGRVKSADIALRRDGSISEFIGAFHEAMVRMTGRLDLRDAVSRYEAVSIVLGNSDEDALGQIVPDFPVTNSPLHVRSFFSNLYQAFDLRYFYSAKNLKARTKRMAWDPESPAIHDRRAHGLTPRLGDETAEPVPTFEVDEPYPATADSSADGETD